jgi:predicted esterase
MNKRFYYLGVVFLGLAIAMQTLIGILYFRLDFRWVSFQSAGKLFTFNFLVSLAASIFLLRYLFSKRYWFAFSAFSVEVASGLSLGLFTYFPPLHSEANIFAVPLTYMVLVAGILFAVSLITSAPRKIVLLLAAGVCLLLGLVIRTLAMILARKTHGMYDYWLTMRWMKWSAVELALMPLLIMFQFLKEASRSKWKGPSIVEKRQSVVSMGLIAIIALGWMIFTSVSLDREGRGLPGPDNPISDLASMEAMSFDARTFVDSKGDSLPYRILLPLNYNAGIQYPLVVCLHHGGAHGTDNIRQVEAAEPAWLLRQSYNMEKFPAIIFVPQCPPGFSWGGIPSWPPVDSLVFGAIRNLEGQYSIDVNRIYVAGVSMGGYGAWHFICTRPKMFAAAISIAGAGDTALAKNAIDIPMWAFHGTEDKNVPVEKERNMIEAVRRAGGHPLYTEFTGADHNIWNLVGPTPGLLDWLFAQKRVIDHH